MSNVIPLKKEKTTIEKKAYLMWLCGQLDDAYVEAIYSAIENGEELEAGFWLRDAHRRVK